MNLENMTKKELDKLRWDINTELNNRERVDKVGHWDPLFEKTEKIKEEAIECINKRFNDLPFEVSEVIKREETRSASFYVDLLAFPRGEGEYKSLLPERDAFLTYDSWNMEDHWALTSWTLDFHEDGTEPKGTLEEMLDIIENILRADLNRIETWLGRENE